MKTPNTVYHNPIVTREKREKLNNHKAVVVWLTGLSGSGKSSIAHSVEEKLYELGCKTFVLDGDNVRHGLSADLKFSDQDRKENIRRIGEASKLMLEAGMIVMSAFISPFEHDRNLVRRLFNKGDFIEIYCNASIETCESRDVKGLYKRARNGEIENYTGIDSPYEVPRSPELIVDTNNESLEESVSKVIDFLRCKHVIS